MGELACCLVLSDDAAKTLDGNNERLPEALRSASIFVGFEAL